MRRQTTRLPLRVAVYDEIARAVRNGVFRLGEQLPTEAELCSTFLVSRTVMREALILLEEDGLIRTVRGIGRFVSEALPTAGLERLQPVERLFARDGVDAVVRRLRVEQEPCTDFTAIGLALDASDRVTLWESVVVHGDDPVSICQEWTLSSEQLARHDATLHAALEEARTPPRSMLASMLDLYGSRVGSSLCSIAVSNAGGPRARTLGLASRSPVLLLSQQVFVDGLPLYLGKHIVRADAVHLAVVQS